MRRTIVRILVLIVACLGGACTSVLAQEHSIKMSFLDNVGSDFALLLMGSREGEVSLVWEDGSVEKHTLHTTATAIRGKTKSKNLELHGDIAVLECSGNGLGMLDVTNMPPLTDLISRKNYFTKLDLTKNANLRALTLESIPLETLDLSNNMLLDSVVCQNSGKMTSFVMPSHSPMQKLVLEGCPRIPSLDLSGAPELRHLNVAQVWLKELDLSNNKKISYLFAGFGYLNNRLEKLVLPKENEFETILLPATGLTELDLRDCKKLKTIATNNSVNLAIINIEGLTELSVIECPSCAITSLDLSQCTKLTNLICNNNQIKTLCLDNCPLVWNVTCYANKLETLELSKCSLLKVLDCSRNPMLGKYELPMSLETLDISACNLSEISAVQGMKTLNSLTCSENQITTLDLSSLENLNTIICYSNHISDLSSIVNLTQLVHVNVHTNPIKELTLPNAKGVYYVSVKGTDMNDCALNDLYKSLRPKEPKDDNNGAGGCILLNKTPFVATSNTALAIAKGWQVSDLGDGTGCPEGSPNEKIDANAISIARLSHGWVIGNIPMGTQCLLLYDLSGKLLSRIEVTASSIFVEAPGDGVYLIRLDDKTTLRCPPMSY